MKATIAIPLLFVAVVATMGFSAWSPERGPGTDPSNLNLPRAVPTATTGVQDTGAQATDRHAGDARGSKPTEAILPSPPPRSDSSDAGEIDCPLLKTSPFRRTLGYPCLACFSWMEANAPSTLAGSKRRASLEADQSARAQAVDRLREHNIISAIDTRSSAAILWVMDGFTSLNTESMQKVVDLVFTRCVVSDHAKNMLLIYDSASRERIGTFTERRGLRMVNQLAKK